MEKTPTSVSHSPYIRDGGVLRHPLQSGGGAWHGSDLHPPGR